ncbi:MAG: electron transfer flavoprotein subunit alpha/FixB family protein [Vulcanimicrobiaceae bacterium]
MRDLIVFTEHTRGAVRRVSLELACEAARLAEALGGAVHAVVLGAGAAAAAETLRAYPVTKIHLAEDPDCDRFLVEPQVDYLEAVARASGPALVLVPNTLLGRDLGSRLAARLEAGLTSDVVGFAVEDGRVACISPKLGGLTITTCAFRSAYGVASVRPNAFAASPHAGAGELVSLVKPSGKTYAVVVEEEVVEAAGELGVEEAQVVVSGGRGLGGPEPFGTIIKELADALGGSVGASRAAVDAGWISHAHQVGQTGKTISPKLYLAVGISGAIQHKVGMRTAQTIVAINKDAAAPIGEFADLLVAGDLFAIVPELAKLVRERSAVHA